jgi:hypothetical protein
MQLLITTQVYENYGSRWKPKGGNDYKYSLGSSLRSDQALAEIVEYFRSTVEADNEMFQETIVGYSVVADDYLTEFEQSQLDYEGRIAYPAQQLEMKEEIYYGA